jgi:hypothetical protein
MEHGKSLPRPLRSDKPAGAPEEVQAMVRRAELAVAEFASSYTEWIKRDLEVMRRAFEAMHTGATPARPYLVCLYDVAHNVKGHGTSLGYPLMTSIGELLCRFLRRREVVGKAGLAAVKAHLDAMDLVVRCRLQGDGGAQGEQLVAGLEAIVQKAEQAEAGSK